MAVLYISEYPQNAVDVPTLVSEPATVTQTVAIAAGSAQSAAFRTDTRMVRLHTDAICSILFGTNPTASATTPRLAANQTEYFKVTPGFKVAVITNT